MEDTKYKYLYLKYKSKYTLLKNQQGGKDKIDTSFDELFNSYDSYFENYKELLKEYQEYIKTNNSTYIFFPMQLEAACEAETLISDSGNIKKINALFKEVKYNYEVEGTSHMISKKKQTLTKREILIVSIDYSSTCVYLLDGTIIYTSYFYGTSLFNDDKHMFDFIVELNNKLNEIFEDRTKHISIKTIIFINLAENLSENHKLLYSPNTPIVEINGNFKLNNLINKCKDILTDYTCILEHRTFTSKDINNDSVITFAKIQSKKVGKKICILLIDGKELKVFLYDKKLTEISERISFSDINDSEKELSDLLLGDVSSRKINIFCEKAKIQLEKNKKKLEGANVFILQTGNLRGLYQQFCNNYQTIKDIYIKYKQLYESSISEYETYKTEYRKIEPEYLKIKSTYDIIKEKYENEKKEYDRLNLDYTSKKEKHDELLNKHVTNSKKMYATVRYLQY